MSRTVFALLAIVCLSNAAVAQSRTGQGATLGGVAGAVVGGIIGHQNDETPEGILIGGAVGAVAGGLLGNARDKVESRERYYQGTIYQQQQQLQYQQQHIQQVQNRAVSVADVVSMARSGLSDAVIVNHIQTNGVQRRLEVSDIIQLHQQGVSENVITMMQQAAIRPIGATVVQSVPQQPTTVIVHESYPVVQPVVVPRPVYYSPAPYYYYPRHHRHGF